MNKLALLLFLTLSNSHPASAEMEIVVHKHEHRLDLYSNNVRIKSYDVITGKKHSPTPNLQTQFSSIDINPTWNPTASSIREFRHDPELAAFNGVVHKNGRYYAPPSTRNPIGKARLNLDYHVREVRIHGTSQPELFQTQGRNYSHGCIRVLEIKDLVETITNQRIDWKSAYSIKLPEPVKVTVID